MSVIRPSTGVDVGMVQSTAVDSVDRERVLWYRFLGRPASEYGTLCHRTGAADGATAAGGR
jgi:hypothetical protein